MQKYPKQISQLKERIDGFKEDIEYLSKNENKSDEKFASMEIGGKVYTDKEEAGKTLLNTFKNIHNNKPQEIGSYRGFKINLSFDSFHKQFNAELKNSMTHRTTLGSNLYGNIIRLDNTLNNMPKELEKSKIRLEKVEKQLETSKIELEKPFSKEEELKEKQQRLNELDNLLNMENDNLEEVEEEHPEVNEIKEMDFGEKEVACATEDTNEYKVQIVDNKELENQEEKTLKQRNVMLLRQRALER